MSVITVTPQAFVVYSSDLCKLKKAISASIFEKSHGHIIPMHTSKKSASHVGCSSIISCPKSICILLDDGTVICQKQSLFGGYRPGDPGELIVP